MSDAYDRVKVTKRRLDYVKRQVGLMGHSLGPWKRPSAAIFQAECTRCGIVITFDPEGGDDAVGYGSGDFDRLIGCAE